MWAVAVFVALMVAYGVLWWQLGRSVYALVWPYRVTDLPRNVVTSSVRG